MKARRIAAVVMVSALFLAAGAIFSFNTASAKSAKHSQTVLIHLSRMGENSHAALMATHLAQHMQEQGAKVTMLLDVEGVRLADKRQASGSEMNDQISSSYDAFVKAGGKVLVCPHCAKVAGLTEKDLRPGAHIATNIGEITDVVLTADKTIDY